MMVYVILAIGALFLVGTVLLLCMKKLPLRWGISLILCGLILCGTGTVWLRSEMEQKKEDYSCVYMALRYLEQGRTEPAALYLQRTNLRNDYHLLSTQVLLEQMRGNDTMAQVRLDLLQKTGGMTLEQEDGVDALRTWSPEKEKSLGKVVDLLVEQLPLSQNELNALEERFDIECGLASGDWDDGAENGEPELLRMQINTAMGMQNWEKALDRAVELVHVSPKASDRLLLATVVAELTYFNSEMETRQFAAYEESGGLTDTQAEEEAELVKEYERLQRKLEVLQLDLEDAEGADTELLQQEKELSQQVEEAQMQAENIFAYRALNSIVDIHTLEAQIVRAKLYFAMRNYQQAIDTLCESAASVQARLSNDTSLVNSLQSVQKAYENENVAGVDSDDFRSQIQMLMGRTHPDLINVSLSPLSQAFTERIIDDQKQYSDGLYVMDFDVSQYPQISVQLGGQERVIERIADKDTITVNDTRRSIGSYQVTYNEGTESLNSICFVVDVSGSMGGQPLRDAQEALQTFLDNTDGYTEMALVSFESSARTLVELTTSTSQIKGGVDALQSSGGTEITAGIQEGTQALLNARGARTMILMTDGQSDVDMGAVQQAVENDIVIFAIGFGSVNDDLLMQIAEATGGQYLRAETSAELVSVYNSLRRVIGNTVTITYTVADTAAESRYFYIQDGKSGLSVRKDYILTAETDSALQETGLVSVNYSPILQTRSGLDAMLARQQDTFYVYLSGNHMDQITSASIGGLACTINGRSGSSLRLGMPCELSNGVYDLALVTTEGDSLVLSDMLWIGDAVSYRTYSAGSLQITAGQSLLMPDQTLVLGQTVRITDVQTDEALVNTLSAELEGVLAFPAVTLPAGTDDGNSSQLYIGDAGDAALNGILRINSSDRAYDRNADRTIFSGEMTLRYSTAESLIIPSEVSAS